MRIIDSLRDCPDMVCFVEDPTADQWKGMVSRLGGWVRVKGKSGLSATSPNDASK